MATCSYLKPMSAHDGHQVVKPIIVEALEKKTCCLPLGHTLSAIEIIVFVFNMLKNNVDSERELSIKELYYLLKDYMSYGMAVIGQECGDSTNSDCFECPQRQKLCGEKVDYQKLFLSKLLDDLMESRIIWIDVYNQTIGLHRDCRDGYLSAVHQMLDNTLIATLEAYLLEQLNKYGPRPIDEVEMRLMKAHGYLVRYLFSGQMDYKLVDFVKSKANHIEVIIPDCSEDRVWLRSKQNQSEPVETTSRCDTGLDSRHSFQRANILRGLTGRVSRESKSMYRQMLITDTSLCLQQAIGISRVKVWDNRSKLIWMLLFMADNWTADHNSKT